MKTSSTISRTVVLLPAMASVTAVAALLPAFMGIQRFLRGAWLALKGLRPVARRVEHFDPMNTATLRDIGLRRMQLKRWTGAESRGARVIEPVAPWL